MIRFDIDIRKLIDLGMGFEEYFLLYCVNKRDKLLLLTYTNNCKTIDNKVFARLEANGYIDISGIDRNIPIRFEDVTLKDKARDIFKTTLTMAEAEELLHELKKHYPALIRDNRTGKVLRRLHGNKARCIGLYHKILEEVPHEVMCKCARVYAQEKRDSDSENYMQALETWLHQKTYEVYIDEKDVDEDDGSIDTGNLSVI